MAEQIRKKPRARASLDGKRLTPMIDDAEKGRIIAERTRLHERAQSLLADGRISDSFYDTVTDAMNRAGSLQELRGLDTDLDGYADQPTQAPAAEVPSETAPETTDTQDATPQKPQFRSTRERGRQVYYVVDESAAPADSYIEAGTGARLRKASPEEMAIAARQLVNRDPDGPRTLQGDLLPGDTVRETPVDEAQDAAPQEAAAPTRPESNETAPSSNEDIEALIRRLGARSPEERRRRIQEQAGGRNPEPQPRSDAGEASSEAQPEQEREREPGTPPPLTPEQIEHSHRTAGGGEPPHEPTDLASDALERGRPGRHEGAREKKYAIDRRQYVGLNIPTLQQIWADPIQQHFFGEILRTIGSMNNEDVDAVMKRYGEDNVTDKDMAFMNYVRHEYWKWTDAWEKLCSHLTETDVEVFLRRNQMMDSIVGHVGRERGLEVMKQMLRFTAMRDQETFTSIEHELHEVHAIRETYLGRRADKKLQSLADKLGMSRTEFEDVVKVGTEKGETESHEHLVQLFRERAGRGRKVMDFLSRFSPTPLAGSSEIAADNAMKDAKYALNGRFGKTGRMMRHMTDAVEHAAGDLTKVVGSSEVISMVSQEALRNERRVPEYMQGPKSIAEVNTKIAAVNEEGLKQVITQRTQQPDFANGTRAYQDSVLSDLKRDATKTLDAGTGFMSWLLKVLFGTKFNKVATQATGRPVHAH